MALDKAARDPSISTAVQRDPPWPPILNLPSGHKQPHLLSPYYSVLTKGVTSWGDPSVKSWLWRHTYLVWALAVSRPFHGSLPVPNITTKQTYRAGHSLVQLPSRPATSLSRVWEVPPHLLHPTHSLLPLLVLHEQRANGGASGTESRCHTIQLSYSHASIIMSGFQSLEEARSFRIAQALPDSVLTSISEPGATHFLQHFPLGAPCLC